MPAPKPESRLRRALTNGAQLTVLSAFALAQPLLDVLGRNSEFFAVRESTSREIVLFAVAVTFVLPAVLLGLELAAGLVSRALADGLHLVFVGGLIAIVALHALTKTGTLSGAAALITAAGVGAAGALLYRRAQLFRSFLTVLVPVPFVFLALFLFDSPASKLVFIHTPDVQAATVTAKTPVVLIVFDEFSTVSLMNRREGIDAGRYPNFAALAGDSTWFRSATSVYWLSEGAVPAILTGRIPTPHRLPVYSEYPNSVFTLLGGSYRLRVIETLTRLCPRSLCRDKPPAQARAVQDTTGSLVSDVGIVYLHLLVPEPYAAHLPSISESWGNFGGKKQSAEPVRRSSSGAIQACGRGVCPFTQLVSADRIPTLYFLHSLLPHVPYVYLPSGRRYTVDARVLRGNKNGLWLEDWPALQSHQRYLLQLGYTDRALGLVLRRLRATGVYDRALVIVTADHGVSFRPRDQRRFPTASNLEDIAFVPLFVKLPGQKQGRVVDSYARTVDVVPTIARVLGISLPWRVDGSPLVGRRLAADGTVTVLRQDGSPVSAPLSTLRARRSQALAKQVATFGTGSFAAVYRVGPNRELIGRRVAELPVSPSATTGVELDGRELLAAVDPAAELLPSYLEGKLTGRHPAPLDLAIAVDGRIAAVTSTYTQYGDTRFAAFVPEPALRSGRNTVDVYSVRRSGGRLLLEELRGSDASLTLAEQGGRELIESSEGTSVRIEPAALPGTVQSSTTPTAAVFRGATRREIDSVIVFADGRAVYVGRAGNLRPHRILGQGALGAHGFAFELPRALLPEPGGAHQVRVFAVRGAVASELRYAGAYPWAHA